jgi:hypothetical protein
MLYKIHLILATGKPVIQYMNIIRGVNRLIAFLLEIALVISLGYVGYSVTENVYLKYVFAILLPLVAIICWSIFAAPKSAKRLQQPWRMLFRTTMYVVCTLLLYIIGKTTWAISIITIAVINEITASYFKD